MALNLGKKVGPLPVGAWAVVLVAGLGLGLFLRHRANAAGAGPTASAGSPATSAAVPSSGSADQSSGGASASSGYDLSGLFGDLIGGFGNLASNEVFAGIQSQQNAQNFATSTFGSALDFSKSYSSPSVTYTYPTTTSAVNVAGQPTGPNYVAPAQPIYAPQSSQIGSGHLPLPGSPVYA